MRKDKVAAARQRVREAKAAWREAQRQAVSIHKALKRSLRERDVAVAKVRKAERALEDVREEERGRRIGARIAMKDGVLAMALADARPLLPEQVDRAGAFGLDGIVGLSRSKRTIAALAELRRLLAQPKKRGGK